ncbi:hypothetical protein NQ318_017289 [Aromia moschata]|uniref:Maturase K n=1 Tax=Aromia moschata TaxID=1265417 RepID=A0AAV8XYA5_9CUCU|nr:hypothetical protein NQ318_017289 [Aromia moschata]
MFKGLTMLAFADGDQLGDLKRPKCYALYSLGLWREGKACARCRIFEGHFSRRDSQSVRFLQIPRFLEIARFLKIPRFLDILKFLEKEKSRNLEKSQDLKYLISRSQEVSESRLTENLVSSRYLFSVSRIEISHMPNNFRGFVGQECVYHIETGLGISSSQMGTAMLELK